MLEYIPPDKQSSNPLEYQQFQSVDSPAILPFLFSKTFPQILFIVLRSYIYYITQAKIQPIILACIYHFYHNFEDWQPARLKFLSKSLFC